VSHILLADDDDLFRESLSLNLSDEGYHVTSFDNGRDTLSYLQNGGGADVALLDWRMPEVSGLDVLRRMRRGGIPIPVIFLTAFSDDIYEEAALEGGAVDFIDKSRRFSILSKRLELIAKGVRPSPSSSPLPTATSKVGRLELRFETNRALWAGMPVDLTLTEFKIVALLALKNQDVGYRELYDVVHCKGFVAGDGEEGYRTNVRALIKRIRKKFRDVDDSFAQIENYAGFGYRWVGDPS
jgi:two-component system response regulator ChvI